MTVRRIVYGGLLVVLAVVAVRVMDGLLGPSCRMHDAEWQLVTNSHGTYTTNYAVNTEWCLFIRGIFFPKEERLFVAPKVK
jgi:hypothetical protein